MKLFAKHALLLLAAACVGFPLGFWHAQSTIGVGAAMLSQGLALSEYETLADLQYKQADAEHGEQAQLDLLHFMQQMQAKEKIALPRAFAYDEAKVQMRLALLEEQAGNEEGFQQHLEQAQKALNHSDQRWYAEKQMREFIAKDDRESQY
ncbi:MAG TPA: hypothetical protein VEI55_03015 [Candidatus Acidoferrum sp.]|nr:hypothetical protein [Candidatus Acidoferrum sp.]